MSTTTIRSNGSKWYGEPPDSIEKLLEVLAREPLDPWFGEPIQRWRGSPGVRYFGNFQRVSHVFNIHTDDPAVIRRLSRAIRANQRRAARD